MKDTPAGWPRISSAVFYEDAGAAIAWLCRAFGFEARLVVEGEGGSIEHSELVFGEGLIMVGQSGHVQRPEHASMVSPRSTGGGNTQVLSVFVDDADAHCARARAAGAEVFREPETSDYGAEYAMDRTYGARDPEGHLWFFMQRMRDAPGKG
ncbi:MAG TPA: VOC family protein [Kofleriaceae bacterium]|nr:VOC family protein [Kofleriaceae bacterium]